MSTIKKSFDFIWQLIPQLINELAEVVKTLKTSKLLDWTICLCLPLRSHLILSVNRCCISSTCLTSGIFPSKLKTAKVVPVFKVDDPCLIENYGPISILPDFSKNLEKIIYNRISRYLPENMILSNTSLGRERNTLPHMHW